MNPQEQAFINAINANPADFATRLVYADWLEEEGRTVEAAGHRWLAENGKTPDFSMGKWWTFYYSEYHSEFPYAIPRSGPLDNTLICLDSPHGILSVTAGRIGQALADGIDLSSRDELADMDAYYAQLREMEPAE